MAAQVAERARREEEMASIRTAIATLNDAVLATYGGLNEAMARGAALETGVDNNRRAEPMITAGRTWCSARVPD